MNPWTRLRVWWHEHIKHHTILVGGGDWTPESMRQLRRDYPGWVFWHDIKKLDCSCGVGWKGSY